MRIIGGQFGGRHLVSPKGPPVRTTLDHVRQAIFNLLGERIEGARVLELFAGSGAVGLEAFSRGAAHVTLVDRSIFCIKAIEANVQSLSPATSNQQRVTILRSDASAALRRLAREDQEFDIVFLDPPYGPKLTTISLKALADCAIVSPSGQVIVEHDKRYPPPLQVEGTRGSFVVQRTLKYGDTALTFYSSLKQ